MVIAAPIKEGKNEWSRSVATIGEPHAYRRIGWKAAV